MNLQKLVIHLLLEILLWSAGLDDLGNVAEYCQHSLFKISNGLEQALY